MKRVLLALLVLVGAGVSMLPVDRALGHAAVVRSEPAANAFLQQPPATITIVFTEPVDDRASSIRLLDSRGLAIATAAPSEVSNNGLTLTLVLPRLSPGIYNVLYRNVSRIDGHALQGSYPFSLLKANGSLPDAVKFAGFQQQRPRA
jgi:copper transport protein